MARELDPASVLEMGTHQWQPGLSTAVGPDWFPNASHHGTDIQAGPGVDIVCDAAAAWRMQARGSVRTDEGGLGSWIQLNPQASISFSSGEAGHHS